MPTFSNLPDHLPNEYFPDERSDAARNRQLIIEQTKIMLQKMSILDLRMSDLAAQSGVGKGTLYRRFENKSALAKALIIDELSDVQTKLQRKNEKGIQGEELLLWFVKTMAKFNMEHADLISATIMREDMPADWWIDSGASAWLKHTLAASYDSIVDNGRGEWFALSLIPTLTLVTPKPSPRENRLEVRRLEWLTKALLRAG